MLEMTDLLPADTNGVQQAAELLVLGFREHWPHAWPDQAAALAEVHAILIPENICRVARSPAGRLLGWIGGAPQYHGHVWELHPLVVHPAAQGCGIGRALVADFEAQVRSRGGLTIFLGSDDEDHLTSLGGVSLYPDVWEHLRNIRNLRGHPYEFYQKCGFVIVGVIPDANGPGKPDILMAKRVSA